MIIFLHELSYYFSSKFRYKVAFQIIINNTTSTKQHTNSFLKYVMTLLVFKMYIKCIPIESSHNGNILKDTLPV